MELVLRLSYLSVSRNALLAVSSHLTRKNADTQFLEGFLKPFTNGYLALVRKPSVTIADLGQDITVVINQVSICIMG